MGLNIKSEAVHADGVFDSSLTINGIRPRDNVEELAVTGDFDALCRGKNTAQVIGAHHAVVPRYRHHTAVVQRGNMAAGHTDIG